jgi:hypothetical protein
MDHVVSCTLRAGAQAGAEPRAVASALRSILMQLRKVCGHPYLFSGVEDMKQVHAHGGGVEVVVVVVVGGGGGVPVLRESWIACCRLGVRCLAH